MGGYRIPDPQTKEVVDWPRVTSHLDLMRRPGLRIWELKKVAEFVASDPEGFELGQTDSYAAVVRALADRSAAEAGTRVHALTVKVDRGELDPAYVEDEFDGLSRALRRAA